MISFDLPVMGFWGGILVPLIGYVLYPISVVALARFARNPISATEPWPSAIVAIAAHNEEVTIGRAVRSVLVESYPGPPVRVLVGLDGCTDRTGAVLSEQSDPRVTTLDLPRAGKAVTDNRLVAAAGSDVVITTSAGAEFAPGSLVRLLAPFRDPRVGCTTGVFLPRRDGAASAESERLYWSLENRVMDAESRLGILAMASGTALAFRRSLFRPIPPDSDADVTVAPTAVLLGGRVVHVPDAIVYDDGPSSLRVVFRNRRRMTLRALPATVKLIPNLVRARRDGAAIGLTFHKVFRWLTPAAAILWAISAIALVMRGDSLYEPMTFILISLGAVGTVAVVTRSRPRAALASLATAQLAFLVAIADALVGRRVRVWTRDPE